MEYTGPKINGVPTQSIAKRSGIPVSMISKLCGISATLIGLPGHNTGPSCYNMVMKYSSTSLLDAVNNGTAKSVEVDDRDAVLWYAEADCGGAYADTGYYAYEKRGRWSYFFWNGNREDEGFGLHLLEAPPIAFNGPWFNTVFAPSFTDTYAIPATTYNGFYGVQDGTPYNSVYASLRFTINSNIVDGTRNLAGEIYKLSVLEQVEGDWIQATDWRNGMPLAFGDYSLNKLGDRNRLFSFRYEYDPTIGYVNIPWEYQFSYASTDADNEFYYRDHTPFTNKFNQRIFKVLLYPIWEDDTSYYEIVINAGDTNTASYVISQASYYQGVQNG